jgi:hypothetical protein
MPTQSDPMEDIDHPAEADGFSLEAELKRSANRASKSLAKQLAAIRAFLLDLRAKLDRAN